LVGNLVGWLVCSSLSTLGETHDIFSKEHPLPPQARGFTVRLKANLWPLLLLFLESCAFSALLVPVSLMSYTILAGPLVTLWRWASLDARARLHQRNALLGGAAPAPTA
jgi:hypothetical protein